ncbi:RNA polymerase sigma factor, sigma-70 family [Micromonospora pattaloongensis]|uniref:RNA polymerase sigma factor, sigma-70 family n=1 Tax=Micromonospora pattaloongensis TaxID=405436 RepID=A0A1H3GBI9_9ACTN|nr:sigma-70 family RNA polymerase sigma factor [Micromonospora pattaloongensis]SDY00410.1 RNA polymerase sigma factor, sigma-70 family [Micromonospora pattaloongensis]
MPTQIDLSDTDLLDAVRAGDTGAYEELYLRHAGAARGLAYALVSDTADAEDLVAETFAKVFATLRAGRGPQLAFRAYLCTTLRHIRYDRLRHERRLELTDDLTRYESGVPFDDTVIDQMERAYAARAFAQLPERWREVLWHTAVEGEPLTLLAPRLGLTPNAVAALAFRARAGLRQMYLQERARDAGDVRRHAATCRRPLRRGQLDG